MQLSREQYAEKHTSALDNIPKQVLDYTMANHPESQMISGHLQGKFLEMISCMIKPVRILEIGTFTGFSAICLAKGLQEVGILHTIEYRQETAQLAQLYINKSNYSSKIKVHVGDAKEIIPIINQSWDLVFIDADKPGYIDYYELVVPVMQSGSFILADNTLFHDFVLDENTKNKSAKAIIAFNEHVMNDNRTEKVMTTIRDGLSIFKVL